MDNEDNTTVAALRHLRTVRVAGRWEKPTDSPDYHTLPHLLKDEDYASVDLTAMGWEATLHLGEDEVLPGPFSNGFAAKLAVEYALVERDVTILFPTAE